MKGGTDSTRYSMAGPKQDARSCGQGPFPIPQGPFPIPMALRRSTLQKHTLVLAHLASS